MIIILIAGWSSGWIVSLQPDADIQELVLSGNRILDIRSETFYSIF